MTHSTLCMQPTHRSSPNPPRREIASAVIFSISTRSGLGRPRSTFLHQSKSNPLAALNATPENEYRSTINVTPSCSNFSILVTASHRLTVNSRWMASSANSCWLVKYAFINWPHSVLRSGKFMYCALWPFASNFFTAKWTVNVNEDGSNQKTIQSTRVDLPKCLHCVVLPARSHPSSTINAPRSGTFLHIFVGKRTQKWKFNDKMKRKKINNSCLDLSSKCVRVNAFVSRRNGKLTSVASFLLYTNNNRIIDGIFAPVSNSRETFDSRSKMYGI